MRGFIISLLLTSMMFGGYFSDNFLYACFISSGDDDLLTPKTS